MQLEVLPLTGLPVGDVPPATLVCGDPGRASMAAGFLQDAKLLSERREYRSYWGTYEGMPVAICSHGIGAPGAAIAFEELIRAGARRLIRLGTCGGLQPEMKQGHLVIATAAVQNTGYGLETVPSGYPAVADIELTYALCRAAEAAGLEYSSGIILTRDNFYRGIGMPHIPDYRSLSEANVLAVEMECAALFIVGSLRRVGTAAILAVDGNVLESGGEKMETYDPGRDVVQRAVQLEIAVALRALRTVHDDAD